MIEVGELVRPMMCVTCGRRPGLELTGRCLACSGTDYRSPEGVGIAASVLLGLNAVVSLGVVGLDLYAYAEFGDLADGTSQRLPDSFDGFVTLAGAVGAVSTAVLVVTAVVFLVWFYRTRENAGRFVPDGHQLGQGWAIGGWFVPIVCLWFPWRVAADTWQASAPPAADGGRQFIPQRVVSLWWSAWIGSVILGRIAAATTKLDRADPGSTLKATLGLEIAENVLAVAAAVLAILFVRRLSVMQDARAAMTAPAPVLPAPLPWPPVGPAA
ncbi:DUF4328 domain-containing protein [Kitasatospora sp. NPDC004240]